MSDEELNGMLSPESVRFLREAFDRIGERIAFREEHGISREAWIGVQVKLYDWEHDLDADCLCTVCKEFREIQGRYA